MPRVIESVASPPPPAHSLLLGPALLLFSFTQLESLGCCPRALLFELPLMLLLLLLMLEPLAMPKVKWTWPVLPLLLLTVAEFKEPRAEELFWLDAGGLVGLVLLFLEFPVVMVEEVPAAAAAAELLLL